MKTNNHDGKDKYPEKRKVLVMYTMATGCGIEVFDHNFQPFVMDGTGGAGQSVCPYCTAASNGGHCSAMHEESMKEVGSQGSSIVYQCELGLMFWVSPTYNKSVLSGFLRGSGNTNAAVDTGTLAAKCNGAIPPEEFVRRISKLSVCDMEKTRSLSEILLLCAQSLSGGCEENYYKTLRQRSGQMAAISTEIERLKAKHPEGSPLPGYPLEKEQKLIASLRRGDKDEAENLLCELLAALIFANPDRFMHIQLRVLELAVLLARAGTNSLAASENNARFIKQIQDAKTVEDLSGALHGMVENITAQITLYQGIPHASIMRKAERFIQENLDRKISLREIAKVVGLSAPYFSTIFKEEMGENLSRYINRLRVEMAGKLLLETDLSLSEIASECCFEDQSWFSKTFKSFTGLSPGKYRNQGGFAHLAVNTRYGA